MIMARHLEKTYRIGTHQVHAVDRVSLAIPRGQFITIMGPSGSGKSTLLYLLGGLDHPTAGDIVINRQHLNSLSSEDLAEFRRETIGFIFQAFHLVPSMSALENVALPGIFAGLGRAEREERAYRLMHMLGLDRWVDHKPTQLSGGQQQRVAIARALFNDPPIIMADEPTGALDSQTGEHVLRLLERMARKLNKTVVVVTHDARIAGRADRVLRLRDGSIIEDTKQLPAATHETHEHETT
ncbi:MAG: ABC transporter ATP-binding protein [Anaerolineae bacterium]|nr:ABC transporter ATP-binding protein [Anaerolineae bacterium]